MSNILREQLADLIEEAIDSVHDMDMTHSQYAWAAADLLIAEGIVQQWQPIETAPKDETAILWSRKFSIIMMAQWGGYCKMNQPAFTHWMPLPAAPVGVQGGET